MLQPLKLQDEVQAWLDRQVQTLDTGDFDGFRDLFALPAAFVTDKSITVVEDDTMLRDSFDAWRNMMASQGVTDTVRKADAATLLEDDLMSGDYTTFILNDATPVVRPYPSTVLLRWTRGVWKAERLTTGLANVGFPIVVPRVTL